MSLGIAILVIALLTFLVVSKGFRKVAAVALVVLLVAAALLYLWSEHSSREYARKRELAKSFIRHSEVEVVDPRVSFSSYDGSPSKITGRIRNNSRHHLESIELELVFQDCISGGECETVGEADEEIRVLVPPGQSRDFEEHILSGPRLNPKGQIRWHYAIKGVVAQVD